MSSQLEQGRTRFCIKAADKLAALAAVNSLAAKTDKMRGSSGNRHFAWVTTNRFEQASTLEDALEAWRWGAETNEAGDVVKLEFTGEKLGNEDRLFAALAPFVVTGSYIEALVEGQPFRWRFEDRVCHTDDCHVEFDTSPSPSQVLANIHAILYADGAATRWNADTLDAIAAEVAKVIPPPLQEASC
jgi:hypothetical protein